LGQRLLAAWEAKQAAKAKARQARRRRKAVAA
jgi:hypothetical protein